MKLLSGTLGMLLPTLVITANLLPASADTVGPITVSFSNLATGADNLQHVTRTFSFPKFDMSLGSLQTVDLAFAFSGIVGGSATGVSDSASFNSTINHWVFFDFTDLSDNVFIAEPSLRLTASIPVLAQNATISFGPDFQSTSFSFSVAEGDPRFDAWRDGPGNISGRLDVFFSNTTMNADGLQFFHGTDSGTYGGSFSVVYDYVPVPEPSSEALIGVAIGSFLLWGRRPRPNERVMEESNPG